MEKIQKDFVAFKEEQHELNKSVGQQLRVINIQIQRFTERGHDLTDPVLSDTQTNQSILNKLVAFDDRIKRLEVSNSEIKKV
jgi:hypothetical protein